MRRLIPVIALISLLLVSDPAVASEKISVALLPVKSEAKPVTEFFDPEAVFNDAMLAGFGKVTRFDVAKQAVVKKSLDDAEILSAELVPTNANKIAKALNTRLVLFTTIKSIKVEREVDIHILVKTEVAACTVTMESVLYDTQTEKAVTIGPYDEKLQKGGGKESRVYLIKDKKKEELVTETIAKCAKRIRSEVYRLHPLEGKVTSSEKGKVIIDIGKTMGVKVGFTFAIYKTIERKNEATGKMHRMRIKDSELEVTKVTDDSATCKVTAGEKAPKAGSAVTRTS